MFNRSRISALRWLVSAILVALVLASSGHASYLGGKAWLAQRLLNAAWEDSDQGSAAIKPWPWADVHPRALLEIPSLGMQQVVLNDHSGESLAFGPGMVEGNGGIVLAGHRDSHFAFLQDLNVGDRLNWQYRGQAPEHYRVTATHILDTRLHEQLIPPDDTLLLITCYPFDALNAGGPLRYVVVASRLTTF